jgi:alkylhydroperoxidase/carboxymuconolactone decarboxylase family protein YurZ
LAGRSGRPRSSGESDGVGTAIGREGCDSAALVRERRPRDDWPMSEHLPQVYVAFRESFPQIAQQLDALAVATESAGPLDERALRLVKLALAVAKESPGAVRSNVRKALEAGDSADEIRHVVLLAITTCGFPTAIASMQWVDDVLGSRP